MHRLAPLVPVVALALIGVAVLGAGRRVVAQATAPVDHPVVGAWWTENDAPGPGVGSAYAVFHADGTYLEVDPNIGVGVGAWRPTGERSAELIAVSQDIDADPAKTGPGTVTVRKAVAVDEAGRTFGGDLAVEVRIPDGTVVFAAAYTGQGRRLEVEPIGPLGTPAAGTPTS